MERESHWQYMKRRMKEEDIKQGIKCAMSPWEPSRRIRTMEQRITELEFTIAGLSARQSDDSDKD